MPGKIEEVNSLAAKQQELGEQIKKLYINCKKDGTARKTMSYIYNKSTKLNEFWNGFWGNHNKLVTMECPGHSYFTSDYYSQAYKVYTEAQNYFLSLIQTLEAGSSTETSQTTVVKEDGSNAKNKEGSEQMKKLLVKLEFLETMLLQTDQLWEGEHSATSYRVFSSNISEQWKEIKELYEEILTKSDDGKLENYWSIEMRTKKIIIKLLEKAESSSKEEMDSKKIEFKVQPQEITIPLFNGNQEDWEKFYDSYVMAIHYNKFLSKCEKMIYLKCHVRDAAMRKIQYLLISEENYELAWKILLDRYDYKRSLVSKLIDRILDLPEIVEESPKELKRLHDTVSEIVQTFEYKRIEVQSWGPRVSRAIMIKWDSKTNRMYQESIKYLQQMQDGITIMIFLRNRIQSLESKAEIRREENTKKEAAKQKFCETIEQNKKEVAKRKFVEIAETADYGHDNGNQRKKRNEDIIEDTEIPEQEDGGQAKEQIIKYVVSKQTKPLKNISEGYEERRKADHSPKIGNVNDIKMGEKIKYDPISTTSNVNDVKMEEKWKSKVDLLAQKTELRWISRMVARQVFENCHFFRLMARLNENHLKKIWELAPVIAKNETYNYPQAARIVHEFYIDDSG